MNKTKKKTILLIICIIIFSAITGCSGSSSSGASSHNYVGSINSNKYHKPSCEWANKIKASNEVWFSTKQEASSAGYQPCKVCKP